jgi:hypothetical protein
MFCRKLLASPLCRKRSKVSEVIGRGTQKMRKEKAFEGAKAEDASRRWGANYYTKVTVSSSARVSVLLEAL